MKKIINKARAAFLLAAALCIAGGVRAADISRVKSLSIYGTPKYSAGFKNFDYVNPEAPKRGRAVMPEYGGFDNFNPFIFKGNAARSAAGLLLDTLGVTPIDDPASVYPLLAKEFEISNDNSMVGFILDERAKFSDGSPVTADDVIFSFKALTEKGAPIYKVYYSDVERVEKAGPRHVRFYFKKDSRNRELPIILAQMSIFSAADFKDKDFSTPSLEAPLGSGPYRLEKFEQGKYLVFKRRPDYWAQNLPSRKGYFNFDEVRYDYYQDTTVTLQALFAGSIDMREEYIAKIWASGYNNERVKNGTIIKDEIPHNQAAVLQYFGFNTRLDKFKDKRVREAIGLAFNFDWANEKLFYNLYERIYSYFTNTGMEATGLPQGKELEVLNRFRSQLPEEVFSKAPQLPAHHDYLQTRANLKQAVKLLQAAGYDFKDGKMTNLQNGEPLEIEILSNSANGSSFTRVMLPFIENLKKIGIKAVFRNIETNIFKNRMDNFDYEIAILAMGVSRLPGNEQRELWGSQSADIKGSYNFMGIKNPVADKLIEGLIAAHDQQSYIGYVKALDRVLLNEHYIIPQWYAPDKRVAYQNRFERPKTEIKTGFEPFIWWVKE